MAAAAAKDRIFNMRLTEEEMSSLHGLAESRGFKSTSNFLRDLLRREASSEIGSTQGSAEGGDWPRPVVFSKTKLGTMYHGDSRGLLTKLLKPASVDLIVTSPPFGLVHQKEYGNTPADEYVDWFRPFAAGIRRVLKENGSLVVDIGPAWNRGLPTKSLYQFDLLRMLCREYELYLAQDFYWWNPCRMPAPAEWVNVRRLRVKDAVNPVWWLSPSPWPKASNRRVLTGYGADQQRLFQKGYNVGRRPSGHVVSENWSRDNGGAVPPNLIAAPNTLSGEPYQAYCRIRGIAPHPARFPWALPEFFIRMLTDKGDFVVDPFGGSCLSGAVAEYLGRRWACCEIEEAYLQGAAGRFEHGVPQPPRNTDRGYRVPTPLPDQVEQTALPACGGRDLRLKSRERAAVKGLPKPRNQAAKSAKQSTKGR